MNGTYTLTGTITEITNAYSSKGITLIMQVKGRENKPIQCYRLNGMGADVIAIGDTITVNGTLKNYKGTVEFDKPILLSYQVSGGTVTPPDASDPYANVSKTQFYATYTPATNNEDAYYRSLHGFMSGSLTTPDQAPTISNYQPSANGKLIRNSEMLYEDNGNAYTVVNAYGEESFTVYRSGAYITLEEVAAYVYAFGTYPKNYTTSKNTQPGSSIWGKYLRLNHTRFSGDTSSYRYEPELPNITGCGGRLQYYEMDIGTTGTDCDPSYTAAVYNNGSRITRGAARIVYGKNDLNGNGIYEIGELHLFYTYNHYNDFQEYLNYENGWGKKFGNITGGGTISSNSHYNPTPYVEISFQALPKTIVTAISYYYEDKKSCQTIAYPTFFIV